MNENQLKDRTKAFAVRILRLIDSLPETRAARVIANQLGRSGASVGANYRAVCRSRSAAEMASRLAIVEEEADESAFWLEVAIEVGAVSPGRVVDLAREAGELTAIMVASRRTLAQRNRKSKIENRESR